MRHATLLELAERDGIVLPDALVEDWPPQLSAADEKGWFRFQRLYDVARSVLRTEDDVRRLVPRGRRGRRRRRRPLAGDPGRPERLRRPLRRDHRLHRPGARRRARAPPPTTGLGIAVVIAANRTRHPLDARTLARLAAQYAGRGRRRLRPVQRRAARAPPRDFAPAFAIAERAGLLLAPHGGELLGPDSVRACLDDLHAPTGSVTASGSPRTRPCSTGSSTQGVPLEVCPVSNVALGVYSDLTSVPLPELLEAGATVALGADDPLLFGSRLAGQYATMRAAHDLDRRHPRRAGADVGARVARAGGRAQDERWPTSTPGSSAGQSALGWAHDEHTGGRADAAATAAAAATRPVRPSSPATGSSSQSAQQPPPQGSPYGEGSTPPPYGSSAYGPCRPVRPAVRPAAGLPAQPTPPDHPKATTALVLGILGIVVCGVHRAVRLADRQAHRRRDRRLPGPLGGRGPAQAGYILGIIGTVLLGLGLLRARGGSSC